MSVPYKTSALLEAAGAAHGFFGRHGGVSQGLYSSLNTGTGSSDDPKNVAENRRRCAEALGVIPEHLLSVYQVHSPDVVIADGPWPRASDGSLIRPRADGFVTNRTGLALGILTADCMPWLFVDPEARVIGAAHGGWRGALCGVLEATIAAMQKLGASPASICAALGPSLRKPNFEVGMDLVEAFTSKYPEAEQFFSSHHLQHKRWFDLAAFGAMRLNACEVYQIDDLGLCTLGAPDDWFSYRASRRAGEADGGRNLSAIALPVL